MSLRSPLPLPLAALLVPVAGSLGCGAGSAAPDAAALAPRVAYCATALGCALLAPGSFTACASSSEGPPLSVQTCIVAAGSDCAAARACTWDASHPSLCAIGASPRCDGTVALTCDGMTTTTSQTDCALAGEVCVASATAARCALATCDAPGGVGFCDGTIAVGSCARPFLRDGVDCAPLAADCVVEPGPADAGAATCRGRGGGCIVPTCEGAELLDCLDGRSAARPCPDGERCFPAAGVYDHATCALAAECDASTFFDDCDVHDGVLTYCRRGLREKLDCRALGFAGCRGSPASGCVPTLLGDGGGRPLTDAPLP